MNRIRTLTAFATLALLGACVAPTVPQAWVEADRLTYEAIAPEYRAYVEADPAISLQDRELRYGTLAAWKLRIDAHGIGGPPSGPRPGPVGPRAPGPGGVQ